MKYYENEQRATFCEKNKENALEEIPIYKIAIAKELEASSFNIYKSKSRKEQQHLYEFLFEVELNCEYKDVWEDRRSK